MRSSGQAARTEPLWHTAKTDGDYLSKMTIKKTTVIHEEHRLTTFYCRKYRRISRYAMDAVADDHSDEIFSVTADYGRME